MKNSKIEWCHHTFNPWIGCSPVGEGCLNCYARALNNRFKYVPDWNGTLKRTSDRYWVQAYKWDDQAKASGQQVRVFAGSMCDVFDDRAEWGVDLDWMGLFSQLITDTKHLTWLLLTKRPQNILKFWPEWLPFYHENVWVGVSASTQREFDDRVEYLRNVKAPVRFVSLEPLLEPINLFKHFDILDWVIVGGETGTNARRFCPSWAEQIRVQCNNFGIDYFFKKMGDWMSKTDIDAIPKDHDLFTRQFPSPHPLPKEAA